MTRVIHLYGRSYGNPYPAADDDRFYWSSWAASIAERIHLAAPDWRMELWRAEKSIQEPRTKDFPAFTARLFPSTTKPVLGEYSPELIKALQLAAQTGPILLHSHAIHSRRLFQAIQGLRGRAPVIAQNHGDFRPFCGGRCLAGSLADFALERHFLRKVDHFFYLRREEKRYLDGVNPMAGKTFMTVGLDFAQFRPANREEAKRRLGLDPSRKVILYVGYLYELKGVHHLIDAFQNLRRKHPLELLLVGGRTHDPLYERAREIGAIVHGRVSHEEIVKYYQAADVYVVPAFLAGGYDVSSIEAAACGVPSVNTYLGELPAGDAAKLGLIPRDGADVTAMVDHMLSHQHGFPHCRSTAEQHFSWSVIAARIVDTYRSTLANHVARPAAAERQDPDAELVSL